MKQSTRITLLPFSALTLIVCFLLIQPRDAQAAQCAVTDQTGTNYTGVSCNTDKECQDTCTKVCQGQNPPAACKQTDLCSSAKCSTATSTSTGAPATNAAPTGKFITPQLGVPIPGLTFSPVTQQGGVTNVPFLAQYISAVYRYLVGVSVIIAIIMVVYGGFRYLLGSAFDDIARGKEIIQDAIAGLILIFAAYLILQTINPATLNLNVLGLTTITFTEGEHGGEEALEPAIVSAAGGTDEFRKQSCDGFATSGEEFQASFTHYFKPPYGDSSNYSSPKTVDCGGGVKPPQTCLANPGSEVSGNPPDIDAPWSFFCAVAMECSCPRGLDTTKRCYSGGKYSPSGERQGWYPCSPFGRSVPYCDGLAGDGSGQQEAAKYSPNKTVAADKDCFSVRAGCQILVDGSTTLTITDSGSGIRGRRFDLYTTKGGSPSVSSGSHKVKVINPDVCKPAGSYRGGAP